MQGDAMPLTDTAIRKAKPADKPGRLFDGGGMYLEVAPAGGKWWRLKYRHGGKEKRLSLGTYPDTGLKDTRDKRDAAQATGRRGRSWCTPQSRESRRQRPRREQL